MDPKFLSVLSVTLLASSCGSSTSSSSATSAEPAAKYETKTVQVYYPKSEFNP